MQILSVKHGGLKRLVENNDESGLSSEHVKRIRNVLTALLTAPGIDSVKGPPGWRVHQLRGNRAGTWSISVTGNWRITFKIEGNGIIDLNFEDYH